MCRRADCFVQRDLKSYLINRKWSGSKSYCAA
jgi:hypothetical protein